MATIRREVIIDRHADDVWAVVGDPGTIHQWFPGIVDCTIERTADGFLVGGTRTIVTGSGIPMPEKIITVDSTLRRFQYHLDVPMVQRHLGTVDVFDLGDGRSLVSYSTDCEPDVAALVIGGATGGALAELRRQLESSGSVD